MRKVDATFGHWRKGNRWTAIEDKKITAENRPGDRELSKALGRSLQPIQKRRSRIQNHQ